MKRYWDGNVRTVESVRYVGDSNGGRMRIEKFNDCGHEQVFEGKACGSSANIQNRVCRQCEVSKESRP